MPIAREGLREMLLSTLVLGIVGLGFAYLAWPLALPFVVVWIWVIAFFRDPKRVRTYAPGDLCAPADGTVTEIVEFEDNEHIGGPAVRIGIFLSLFNVHINRSPCAGCIRSMAYFKGEFLDARHPESGQRNESNMLVIDPEAKMPGPVIVRQVAGLVARRIICNAQVNDQMTIGHRFGLIKFGSRTELIIPRLEGTQILVSIGQAVKGGLTIMATQPIAAPDKHDEKADASEKKSADDSQVATR